MIIIHFLADSDETTRINLFDDSLEDPDGLLCAGHGTGWLVRHRGWADSGDACMIILLNEDGS